MYGRWGMLLVACTLLACSGGDPFSAAATDGEAPDGAAGEETGADAGEATDVREAGTSSDAGVDSPVDAGVDAGDPMCTPAPNGRSQCWSPPGTADCEPLRAECGIAPDASLLGYACSGTDCYADFAHNGHPTLCPMPIEAGSCFGPVYTVPPYGRILCCVQ